MPVAFKLHYFAHESDNYRRPPSLLIHGAGGHHLYWPPQIRRLPNQRMLALDLPGHGRSYGLGHQRIEEYVQVVIEFIKALRINAVVLVGHSMGGAIALKMAISFSERVLGLVLLGSAARLRVAPAILQSASQSTTFPAALNLIADLSFATQTSKRLKEMALQRMTEMRPSVLHGDLLACDSFDAASQLSSVVAPTLILCGAEDRMSPPRNSESLHKGIAASRLEIVPNAGHMLMLEQPDLVADRLGQFLDEIPYRPGR